MCTIAIFEGIIDYKKIANNLYAINSDLQGGWINIMSEMNE